MRKYLAVLAIISLVIIGNVFAADENADAIINKVGSGQLISGPISIQSITIKGTTAGDNIGIYDYAPGGSYCDTFAGSAKDLEFELGISANNSSTSLDTKNIKFKNGVYIASSASTTLTTVLFDY